MINRPSKIPNDELRDRFAHHPPSSPTIAEAHQQVRVLCSDLAVALNDLLPECREKSLALTGVQDVMQWSNTAIAIHQRVGDA